MVVVSLLESDCAEGIQSLIVDRASCKGDQNEAEESGLSSETGPYVALNNSVDLVEKFYHRCFGVIARGNEMVSEILIGPAAMGMCGAVNRVFLPAVEHGDDEEYVDSASADTGKKSRR